MHLRKLLISICKERIGNLRMNRHAYPVSWISICDGLRFVELQKNGSHMSSMCRS